MKPAGWGMLGVMLAFICTVPPAYAVDRFDLIIYSHDQVTTYNNGPLFYNSSYCCNHCGVLVNTGTEPITATDILMATQTVGPADPSCQVGVVFDISGLTWAAPILPGEAVSCPEFNELLTALVLADETPRSSCSSSTVASGAINLARFQGTAAFDVTIAMGGQKVRFPWKVDVRQVASYDSLSIHSGEPIRVSSGDFVPTVPVTWGRVKSLYR
jgi:hypothetical protein